MEKIGQKHARIKKIYLKKNCFSVNLVFFIIYFFSLAISKQYQIGI